MYILIGLGNPGQKYEKNRHNIGFQVLDEIARIHSLSFKDDKYTFSQKASFGAECELVKPQTFMNDSGKSAKAFKEGELVVVYDDIDINIGTVKCSFDRGAGGHNGVQSIIDHVGTKAFARIRVGVRPVHAELLPRIAPPDGFEKYVLSDFAPMEKELHDQGINRAIEIIAALKNGKSFDEVTNEFN